MTRNNKGKLVMVEVPVEDNRHKWSGGVTFADTPVWDDEGEIGVAGSHTATGVLAKVCDVLGQSPRGSRKTWSLMSSLELWFVRLL